MRKNDKFRFLNKFRGQSGETLVETLVSVLVAGMSMLMLATVISMASNIVSKSYEVSQDYYENSSQLASRINAESNEPKPSLTVSVKTGNTYIVQDEEEVNSSIAVKLVARQLPGGIVGVSYKVDE